MAIKDQITITTKDDQGNPLIKGLFSQISLKGNRYEVQDTAARDAIDNLNAIATQGLQKATTTTLGGIKASFGTEIGNTYPTIIVDNDGFGYVSGAAMAGHNHDDRYYTETEIDGFFTGIRGTSSDAASAETIAGAKKYAADAVAALAQTVEDTYAGLDSTTLATINQIKAELQNPDNENGFNSFLDTAKTTLSKTVKGIKYDNESYTLSYTKDDPSDENATWDSLVNAQTLVTDGLQIATGETLGGIKGTSYESTVDFSQSDRYYGVIIDQSGLAYVNVPWTDTHVTAASTTTLGGIKLYSAKGSTAIEPQTASTAANRYYQVQLDSNNKAFVNVPWTDTLYTLPQATASVLGGVKVSYNYTSALDNIHDVHAESDSSEMLDSHYQYHFGLQSDSTGKAFVNIPQLAYLGGKLESVNYSGGKLKTTTDSNGSSFTEVVSASQIVTDGDGLKKSEMKVENQILYLG